MNHSRTTNTEASPYAITSPWTLTAQPEAAPPSWRYSDTTLLVKPSRGCHWLGQRAPVPIAARTLACQPPALFEYLLRSGGGVGVYAIDDLVRDRFVSSSDAVGFVDSRQVQSRFVLVRRGRDGDLAGPPGGHGVTVREGAVDDEVGEVDDRVAEVVVQRGFG